MTQLELEEALWDFHNQLVVLSMVDVHYVPKGYDSISAIDCLSDVIRKLQSDFNTFLEEEPWKFS